MALTETGSFKSQRARSDVLLFRLRTLPGVNTASVSTYALTLYVLCCRYNAALEAAVARLRTATFVDLYAVFARTLRASGHAAGPVKPASVQSNSPRSVLGPGDFQSLSCRFRTSAQRISPRS